MFVLVYTTNKYFNKKIPSFPRTPYLNRTINSKTSISNPQRYPYLYKHTPYLFVSQSFDSKKKLLADTKLPFQDQIFFFHSTFPNQKLLFIKSKFKPFTVKFFFLSLFDGNGERRTNNCKGI